MANPHIAAALRWLRKRRNMTMQQVAARVRVHTTTISARERAELGMDDDDIDAYLKAIGASRQDYTAALATVRIVPKPTESIPLLPSIASAGQAWLDRGDAQEFPGDVRPVPRGRFATHPAAFAVTVEGNSMAPYFQSGDVIICEPVEDDEWMRLQDGRTVVAWVSPAVKQSSLGRAPSGTMHVSPAGNVGTWEWQSDGSALLRKKNAEHRPVWLPAVHDGNIFLAMVVEVSRPVY
jgi:transcriptional regulator with XRE-family HTH domain